MASPPERAFWSVPPIWQGETVAILGGGPSLTQAQVDYCRGKCRVIAINRAYALAPWADWLHGCDGGGFWAWCSRIGPERINPHEPDPLDFEGIKTVLWSYAPGFQHKHADWIPPLIESGVRVLQHHGDGWHTGISHNPYYVRGNNGVYQMLSVLHFTGVKRIILLGTDMSGDGNWHQTWPLGAMKHEAYDVERRPHEATISLPLPTPPGVLSVPWIGLGWYRTRMEAKHIEEIFAEHIRQGCPQPAPHLSGVIPMFATLVQPYAEMGIQIINCSPGTMLRAFPRAKLEEVLL